MDISTKRNLTSVIATIQKEKEKLPEYTLEQRKIFVVLRVLQALGYEIFDRTKVRYEGSNIYLDEPQQRVWISLEEHPDNGSEYQRIQCKYPDYPIVIKTDGLTFTAYTNYNRGDVYRKLGDVGILDTFPNSVAIKLETTMKSWTNERELVNTFNNIFQSVVDQIILGIQSGEGISDVDIKKLQSNLAVNPGMVCISNILARGLARVSDTIKELRDQIDEMELRLAEYEKQIRWMETAKKIKEESKKPKGSSLKNLSALSILNRYIPIEEVLEASSNQYFYESKKVTHARIKSDTGIEPVEHPIIRNQDLVELIIKEFGDSENMPEDIPIVEGLLEVLKLGQSILSQIGKEGELEVKISTIL